tara:strand:+ start:188 stop:370 length:183 start_codon:yes stop_codon:yes gene_type:complete
VRLDAFLICESQSKKIKKSKNQKTNPLLTMHGGRWRLVINHGDAGKKIGRRAPAGTSEPR